MGAIAVRRQKVYVQKKERRLEEVHGETISTQEHSKTLRSTKEHHE